jgi:4-hydroxy-tetrahydrodipicolinate synthase
LLKEVVADRRSDVTRVPLIPPSGEEKSRVEKLYNDAVSTRIGLSKFNLD